LLATSLAFAARAASAQETTDATPKKDDTVKMETFNVTGSYLPPAANAVAVPVITINTKSIENSGENINVLDILKKTVPQFSGNTNLGSENGNIANNLTYGGSQLALRNASTLVLVNGRRMAYAPVGATGGYQFVDVNMIPVSAIDRIEILADGASAIYGSDAVGGVVNIILKSDYEGFETGGRYGWSTNQGNYAERSAYIVGGTGNGKTSMTVSAEWVKVDPILNYERPFATPTYGTQSFAGSVSLSGVAPAAFYLLNPSLNAPAVVPGGQSPAALVAAGVYSGPNSTTTQTNIFNLARYVTMLIGNDRQAMTLDFNHKITDSLAAFGDFMYSYTHTLEQINGQPITATIQPGGPNNPFNVAVVARNRLVDHPRQYLEDTLGIRGVVGLRGKITEDWSWESAADYNRIQMDYQNSGVINQANLSQAIADGTINLFAIHQAPGAVDSSAIVGTATGTFVSSLSNYDLKVHGKVFDLPAGSLDLAAGAEIRQESLSAVADPLSQISPVTGTLGWNGATTLYPFNVGRTVKSLFGEVRVPLLKDLPGAHLVELTAAVRTESYSDTDGPTVPKIQLRYLPFNDEFALRGTYSKSFSAPTLFQLYGPSNQGFSPTLNFTALNGTPVNNIQTLQETGSNPALHPARSENFTVGTVYSPKAIKGLSVSVDYWNIRQSQLVATLGAATIVGDVELNGPASPYARFVHFGSFTGAPVTAKGQMSTTDPSNIYVTNLLVNLASVKQDGVDATVKYVYNDDNVGRFEFNSNFAIYAHYSTIGIPGTAAEEDVGQSSVLSGTIPRWSNYTSVDFTRGSYHAAIGERYIPSVTDNVDGTTVGSWYTTDLSADYTFGANLRYLGGARLTLGVNNVFNKMPPVDPTIYGSYSNADIGTYNPIGRFIYADLKFKF
jgi:iron complex outermembrane receptor protein